MKNSFFAIAVASAFAMLMVGCDFLGSDTAQAIENALSQDGSAEMDTTAAQDLLDGKSIVKDGDTLSYVQDELYVNKVMRLGGDDGATYFAKSQTAAKMAARLLDFDDLVGTWMAYKQIVGGRARLIEESSGDFIELAVKLSGGSLSWHVSTKGSPRYLDDDAARETQQKLEDRISQDVQNLKQECDRPDLTETERQLCAEKIERCAPGGVDFGTHLCVEIFYNPCDRPDLTWEERRFCEDRYDACAPGGHLYGTPECGAGFNPCDRPDLTEYERKACWDKFEACSPGGVWFESHDPRCDEYFDPCDRPDLPPEQRDLCRQKTDRCAPGGPGFGTPECDMHFDPCANPDMTLREQIECRDHFHRCAPGGPDFGTPLCEERFHPCDDPMLTPEDRDRCIADFDRCAPGGVDFGTDACGADPTNPCRPDATPQEHELCRIFEEHCGFNMRPEDAPFCADPGRADVCRPEAGPAEQQLCGFMQATCNVDPVPPENQEFCRIYAPHPDDGGPCRIGATPVENAICRIIHESCGPGMDPANQEFCRYHPDRDPCGPGVTPAEMRICEEVKRQCFMGFVSPDNEPFCLRTMGPGPMNDPMHDPCRPDASPAEREVCGIIEAGCGPGMLPENQPFCYNRMNAELCGEGETPLDDQICESLERSCFMGPMDPANEAFCREMREHMGPPQPYVGPTHELRQTLEAAGSRSLLTTLTDSSVSVTYVTWDELDATDDDPVGVMVEMPFSAFFPAGPNGDEVHIMIDVNGAPMEFVLLAFDDDPEDPPEAVPGTPIVHNGGLGVLEFRPSGFIEPMPSP